MSAALFIVGGAFVALGLAFVRLVSGPSQADRIVALDIMFSATIALTAGAALATGRGLFLDVGLGLAVVGFVATIVWARLVDAWARHDDDEAEAGRNPP